MASIHIGKTTSGREIYFNPSFPDDFLDDLVTFSNRELFDTLLILDYALPLHKGIKIQAFLRKAKLVIMKTLPEETIQVFLRELDLSLNDSRSEYARALISGDFIE